LAELGQDITPLLASAGVVGVALALGAQTIVKDFLGGLFILLEDQYNKAMWSRLPEFRRGRRCHLRRTVLRDLDGIVHSIPNSAITTDSNYTRDWARVNLDVPVDYGKTWTGLCRYNRVGNELAKTTTSVN
jgi:small conductance mechanosensitive channel